MLTYPTIDPRRRDPYVTQIQEQLRAKIRLNELRPGQKLPSIREISTRCGISVGIVKQALSTLTAEGYLRSHRGRGVYVAEPHLSRQNIALVLPSLDPEQMPRIIRGLKGGLAGSSGRLVVQAADFDFDQEIDLLSNLDTSFVAGAIVYPPPLNSYIEPLRELQRRGVPYVLIDTFFESLDVDSVSCDRVEMGRLAIGTLLEYGHRRIGIVDVDADALSIRQMREGADEALGRVGMRFEDLSRVTVSAMKMDPEQPWANGEEAARRLLAAHPDLTAALGMNDNISMGVLHAAKGAGLRVPEDISIIAMGELTLFQVTDPPITSVDQRHEAMGRLAAERLLHNLSASAGEAVREFIKPALRVRRSVAAPRGSSHDGPSGRVNQEERT